MWLQFLLIVLAARYTILSKTIIINKWSIQKLILYEIFSQQFLFLVSTIGTATGLICLGVYMHLKTIGVDVSALNVVPLFSFSFVIFIANWAVLTLPFLVISEIMPEKLKEFGVSFCMELLWIFAFIMLKYLPFLTGTLGMHGTMYLFAGVCLSSAVFIAFVMPETKGKSYDEIMESLR